jgi:hypothetical protein
MKNLKEAGSVLWSDEPVILNKSTNHPITQIVKYVLLVAGLLLSIPSPASAEELDIVNRPVNLSGLTGLLFTTAPYTLSKGTIEVAAAYVTENSVTPDYTLTELPLSISAGVSNNSEIALRGSYVQVKPGPTSTTGGTRRKTGDLDLSYKWNFLPQPEDSIRPAVSLIMGGIIPTDNNNDLNTDSVRHWGVHLGMSIGTEISWKEHILGIYADAQVKSKDPTNKTLRDTYGIYNAGVLFPISKYQNLQMFMEYTLVDGKKLITVEGGDYSGFTYGIRLVSERFNFTMGTQFLRKQTEGYDPSDRIIGLLSMKF